MTLRLILVRHGLSSFNLQKRIQGRNDLSTLTDQGILQAKQAGKELAKIPIKKVYSSPLQRAADTATTLIQERSDNPQVIFDENLLEVDLFAWSGLTIEEVKSKFPDDYLIWKNDPNELVLNNKEGKEYFPIKELMNQATKFINQLLKDDQPNKDSNILIVGHNAILRCLILKLLGEPKNGFRRLKVDNASISLVKVNKKGNETYHTQIESLNNTTHLGYPVPQKGRKARLVLVRHGETNWNKEGRFQGQIDIPLNENGRDQANAAKVLLSSILFTKAFSSSMSRPLETAKIILKNQPNLKINCLEELIEIGHGLWEGKLESEIKEEWSDMLEKWKNCPEKVQMPNGESIQQVWNRAVSSWNEICEGLADNETTLIVAHDAVNKTILCYLLGLTPANIWMIKQGNGGVTVVDIQEGDEQPSVVACMNITSHLGGVIDLTAQGAL